MKKIVSLSLVIFFALSLKAYDGIFYRQNKVSAFQFRKIDNTAFQAGERLRYKVHYGVIDAGEAILEIKASDKKVNGRTLLHAVGKGKSLGAFDWFFKVRDRYETFLDAEGIFPWIFIRRVYEGGTEINQDYTFFQHKQKVNDGKTEYEVPDNIQDMISSFYYARTLDFSNAKKGDVFEFDSFVDREVFPLKIKYLGTEVIKLRKGKFRCMKFCPVIQTGRIFKNEEDLQVWISDDENKIPLLAKAKILVGSIKMEVVGYKGLKNPIAKI